MLRRGAPLALLSTTLISGCATGTLAANSGSIISTVILARDAIGAISTAAGGVSTGGSTRRIPGSSAASARAARVLRTADQYIGVKYVWGGNTPKSGFDCSGFTKYVFAKEGVGLPRTAREQARVGQAVLADFRFMEPGDLMMFAERGGEISHVAIYVGDGQIIHASSGFGEVNYLDLNTSRGDWYVNNLVAVRRVLAADR